jgi:hypothetical protein
MDQLAATSKPDSPVSQTEPSSFCSSRSESTIEDYRTRDSSSTSLVPCRPHAQPEEDPVDDGAKDEERGGQEGEG